MQIKKTITRLRNLAKKAITPSISTDDANFKRARSLIILCFTFGILALVGAFFAVEIPLMNLATLMIFGAYLLSKTRFYRLAPILLMSGLALPAYARIILTQVPLTEAQISSTLHWVPLALVFGGVWLSWRRTVIASGLMIGSLMVMPYFISWVTPQTTTPFYEVSAFSFVLSIILSVTNKLSDDDQKKIRQQNIALEATNITLQQDLLKSLEAQRDLAVSANAAKDQFLSIISHELRTPLNSITGYSEYLLHSPAVTLPPTAENYLQRIYKNAQILSHYVNELLELRKMESDEFSVVCQRVEIRAAVSKTVEVIASLIDEKNLSFSWQVDEQMPDEILTEPWLLDMVMVNLLGNAVKFTHQGSVSLDVKREGNAHWSIEVQDTGIGIAREHIPSIFEKFWRAESVHATIPGTGLGLAIVQKAVASLEGTISVASEPGKGSKFTVKLPLRLVD